MSATEPTGALALRSAAEIPNQLAGFAVHATTMDQAMKVCEWLSRSPLIPKSYQGNPAAIWTAGAMGQRLGLDLFTSLIGVASINGRPCVWGDVLRGLVLAHPALVNLVEDFEGKGDALTAVCTITRKGMDPYTVRFGIADAKAANLLGKDTWRNYTPDMLANRAFGRAARRRFADVLCGLNVAEEMQDAEVVSVRTEPEPRPAKRRTVQAEVAAAVMEQKHAQADENAKQRAAEEDAERGLVSGPADEPDDRADEECAAAEKAASGKTLAEAAKPEPTVARCQDVTAALMKRGAGGKALVAGIMKRWNLRDVAQLGEMTADDRQAYIDEVTEADEECAAAEKAASGKTLAEAAKPEPTVARCQDVTAALMKRGAGGKALVAGIMKRWNLRDVAQLGEMTADDRQAYIDEVTEADAKLEPATGGKV